MKDRSHPERLIGRSPASDMCLPACALAEAAGAHGSAHLLGLAYDVAEHNLREDRQFIARGVVSRVHQRRWLPEVGDADLDYVVSLQLAEIAFGGLAVTRAAKGTAPAETGAIITEAARRLVVAAGRLATTDRPDAPHPSSPGLPCLPTDSVSDTARVLGLLKRIAERSVCGGIFCVRRCARATLARVVATLAGLFGNGGLIASPFLTCLHPEAETLACGCGADDDDDLATQLLADEGTTAPAVMVEHETGDCDHDDVLHRMVDHDVHLITEHLLPCIARSSGASLDALGRCSRRMLGMTSWWVRGRTPRLTAWAADAAARVPATHMAVFANLDDFPDAPDAVGAFRLLATVVRILPRVESAVLLGERTATHRASLSALVWGVMCRSRPVALCCMDALGRLESVSLALAQRHDATGVERIYVKFQIINYYVGNFLGGTCNYSKRECMCGVALLGGGRIGLIFHRSCCRI